MKTDNELIAEFIGFKREYPDSGRFDVTKTGRYTHTLSALRFNSSWDWLKPAIDKISSMRSFDTPEFNMVANRTVCNHSVTVRINELYYGVIEFIKWYNQNLNSTGS